MKVSQTTITIATLFLTLSCQKHGQDGSALAALMMFKGSGGSSSSSSSTGGFPSFPVPASNPMTVEKVTLGRYLFYDKRLSGNQTQACATCHIQKYAFSDGRQTGYGSTGQSHPRSPQQLVNAAYNSRYTWSNDAVLDLETQATAPMYGTTPVELGMTNPTNPNAASGTGGGGTEAIPRLQAAADVDYKGMFAAAFGGSSDGSQITDLNIRKAIASFERTIISSNSYYDQYSNSHNTSVLTAGGLNASYVLAGAAIFDNEKGDCFHCHGGFNYADMVAHTGAVTVVSYHNNGIHTDSYYTTTSSSVPDIRYTGLYEHYPTDITKLGMFRAPSLRNVGVTHPFMHDGSFFCTGYSQPASNTPPSQSGDATCAREALTKVVDNYRVGGVHPQPAYLDLSQPEGLNLTDTERDQLVEFLMSLTDAEFLTRPSLSSPVPASNTNFVQ